MLAIATLLFTACNSGSQHSKSSTTKAKPKTTAKKEIHIPDFNADTAYDFVKEQLDFGPRVPGTEAHARCAAWLETTLRKYSDTVIVQDFKTRVYNDKIFDGQNIIAAFNPGKQARVFLSAHWDSRPYADHDPDPANHNKPIDGANDGASGTGILLEVARQLSMQAPGIGIDIILFDMEDYGPPQDTQTDQSTETWGLGSQYWARNLHVPGYSPRYGILLDMVGAPNAVFPMEGFSMYYAPNITKKVWDIANKAGYSDYFIYDKGTYITDDHYFINTIAQIPTIDIVHLDPTSVNGTFYDYWHTLGDNIDQIDPATLKVVGQTLLDVIYRE